MVSAAALLLAVLGVVVGAAAGHSIKHVVVLMLENRSFDAMLGHLTKLDGRINGLPLWATSHDYLTRHPPHHPLRIVRRGMVPRKLQHAPKHVRGCPNWMSAYRA